MNAAMTTGEDIVLPPPSPPRPMQLAGAKTTTLLLGDDDELMHKKSPTMSVLRSTSPVATRLVSGEDSDPSPRDSRQSTDTIEGSDSARQGREHNTRKDERIAATPALGTADDNDDEFHDLALDDGMEIVPKSIYKEKKSFLTRLRGPSSSRSKYSPGDLNSSVVAPVNIQPAADREVPRLVIDQFLPASSGNNRANDMEQAAVEIVLEEEDSIDVAIEQTTPPRPVDRDGAAESTMQGNAPVMKKLHDYTADEEELHESAPQVVIHSTESDSDSGFATLNPVISRGGRGRRSSTSAIMTSSANGSNPPLLMNLPMVDESSEATGRLALTINALGATGLAKVEKFGTQSTFLELRLSDMNGENNGNSNSCLRTALHKKGGSEAQWNQQFTMNLRSKTKQLLQAVVRTHSKVVVGETNISLVHVKESLYDQHFTLYRNGADGMESAGQLHLQLTVTDAAPMVPAVAVVPTVVLPAPTIQTIPAALKNGALMFKVPYHSHALLGAGATKRQWISVDKDCITWCDPIDTNEKSRRLDLSLIVEVREGARTKAFERLLQSEPSSVAREYERCFSVISKTRTLDLVASSKEEAHVWIQGLRTVLSLASASDSVQHSARTIQDFRNTALSPRDTKPGATSMNKRQQQTQWRSLVFDCARHHDYEEVSALLHAGCPIDILETGTGDTLLMLACRLGDAKLVELCLQWRAKNDPHPEFGETALQVAVNSGHADCLGLILRTAAKSDMDSEIVNHIDSNNDAPLHVASRRGDLACMQLLLHHGADVCVVEEYGRTPLHCAVTSGSVECVAYVLDVGGDSVLNAGDHDGDTALHYAALAGHDSIVKLLLESAADVQSTNVHGESASDLASRESHIGCAKLIAKYTQSAAPEQVIPAPRNEPASSLLQLRHKDEEEEELECDEATEGIDDGESGDPDDQDDRACSEPSYSPVRRGPIEPLYSAREREEVEYYRPLTGRRRHEHRHDHQPISPSARVREVLASQRERASVPRQPVVPPLHFHSARELRDPRYALVPSLDRHAYTERVDRYHPTEYPYHRTRDYEFERPYEQPDLHHRSSMDLYRYHEDRGYLSSPGYGNRGRSMSALAPSMYHRAGYDEYNQWYEPRQLGPHSSGRRANSADMTMHRSSAWQHGYEAAYAESPVPPASTYLPPSPPVVEDQWETYYSEEGYPYYINTRTGISQWENPYESTATATQPTEPHSYTAQHPHISTPATVTAVRSELENRRHHQQATAGDSEVKLDPKSVQTESTTKLEASSPPSSPRSSKYESRTGLSLSVDVSSPPRRDDSKPVFVPSPRSKSPRRGTETKDLESSFDKSSRPSSPRGKSKNVQLIELKRANNLSLALASFKINDRNEQIAQAIASFDEAVVNAELLACLQRFFPTPDEAQQLRSYEGPIKSLGAAERFFFRLLQVPEVVQRIDCFLFKLQFARNYRSTHTKIQVVKRACRDLVENFSFVDALDSFFESRKTRSFQEFVTSTAVFKAKHLSMVDEKLHSFQEDLRKASEIELLDMQLQMNRLATGMASIVSFVEHPSVASDPDRTAVDVLQRFIAENRAKVADLESEFEGLGQWEDKVLQLFRESKASCQLTPIFESICAILETEFGIIL